MTLNLSIKGVPEQWVERLRQRAERHHRSLQGELMAIVEAAASQEDRPPVEDAPGRVRAEAVASLGGAAAGGQVQGWKTVEQLLDERRARGWQPHPSLTNVPLGVDIIRADRDSR